MSSKTTEQVTKSPSLRSLRSRAKAKLKGILPGQLSRNETVAESSSTTPSTLPSSSIVISNAKAVNQAISDPLMSVSRLTNNLDDFALQDKDSDITGSSNIWLKAYKAAAPDTKKWIESLPKMIISEEADDQSWVAEIVKTVHALEKKNQDSSLRITVGQKETTVKDYVAPTMKLLTLIGDISTQFVPAPSGIVWSAIKALLQAPVTGIGETAAILSSTTRVISILRRGKVYEVVFTEDNTAPELLQNFVTALLALYAKSLDLLAYAARYLKNRYRQTLEWISNTGYASSLIAELTQCEAALSRAVECCEAARSASEAARSASADKTHTELLLKLHHSVNQIEDGMHQLFDKMEIHEMLEALDYFSDVKFGEQHRKKTESRTPGTGTWLLTHYKFKEWQQTDESSILWLQGTVGMGKSFLASTVIDQFLVNDTTLHTPIRKNNQGFAYFYCERGSSDLREPINVLRSYVRQLAIVPCFPKCMQKQLIELYRESRKQGVKLSTNVCKDRIFASANLYPRTTLVLDGLDECDAGERGTLIKILAELIQHAKNPVKLFISSRREQDIAKQLELSPIIEISARDNEQDIRKFVDERIERIEETGKWISISQDLKNKIKDTLCAKSDGMFRWTYLQIDQLSKLRQAKQIEARLGKLPKTLNAAYQEIFEMIEEDGGGGILESAVKWVMCVKEPLTTDEILDAVRLSPSSDGKSLREDPKIAEETLLGICGHLIVKEPYLGKWKFPHTSVIEYFEEVHQWSLERAHSFVAGICLLHLLDDHTQRMEDGRFSGKRNIRHYMLEKWPIHVSAIEKPELHGTAVSKLLERFLGIDRSPRQSSQHYQHWVNYIAAAEKRYDEFFMRHINRFRPVKNFYPAENPIFGICILGFYHILQSYWSSDIDISSVNKRNMDLLSIAAYYGHLEICEKLIELGSDVNRQFSSSSTDFSVLTTALEEKNVDVVSYLLRQGANPNLPLNGASSLCTAINKDAFSFDLKCAEILLDAKADPNYPCGPQCTFTYALEAAAYRRNIEATKLLLRHGADVNLLSEIGDYGSALAAAASRGAEEICQLLIEDGADVNADLKAGKYGSALVAAALQTNERICQLFVKHGAEVNADLKVGKYGSALVVAAHQGNTKICQFLIEQGADVNADVKVGIYGSALVAAAVQKNKGICQLLIDHGADVNADLKVGIYGSALAAAALLGNCAICRLLIDHGADVNASLSGKYPSALEAAKRGGKRARRAYRLLSGLEAMIAADTSFLPSRKTIDWELLPDPARLSGSSSPISMLEGEDEDSDSYSDSIADSLNLHRQRLAIERDTRILYV
ncbi:hypothetical protein J3F84DRAFT_363334 [Trichoderma pleuroticola]